MKKIKNSTIFAIILTILVIGIHTNIHAAGMGMSINKSSAYVGDSFSITISGINGKVSISGNSNVSLSTSGTKWVEGSNYVDVNFKVDPRTHRVIMMGAIDNLVKGAAGQAVQNMNLAFGLDESTALNLVPMFP